MAPRVHANAARRSTLSHEHASRIEAPVEGPKSPICSVRRRTDRSGRGFPDGMQIPRELSAAQRAAAPRSPAPRQLIEARGDGHRARSGPSQGPSRGPHRQAGADRPESLADRVPAAQFEGAPRADEVGLTDEYSRSCRSQQTGSSSTTTPRQQSAADSLLVVAADVRTSVERQTALSHDAAQARRAPLPIFAGFPVACRQRLFLRAQHERLRRRRD